MKMKTFVGDGRRYGGIVWAEGQNTVCCREGVAVADHRWLVKKRVTEDKNLGRSFS